MSPNATTIEQEGVLFDNLKLVDRGRFREKELLAALTGAKYPARNPVQNIYIKKVEKKKMFGYDKDELWNTVVKTYNDVSTYWQYDPAKFRAQPVYSRDYPPCKYCE